MKRSLNKIAGFWGGAIVESVQHHPIIFQLPVGCTRSVFGLGRAHAECVSIDKIFLSSA